MKKKLLLIGAVLLGLTAVSCNNDGNIPDPEPVNLTNGFAKFIENTGADVAKYYVALTTGNGTSIDDITGPGDILLLELLTENTSTEDSYISPGTYTFSSTSTVAGTVLLSYNSQFGKVGSSGDMDLKLINGGSMTVSESGGVYTISGTFTEPGGEEFDFNYSGAITFPAKPLSMTNIDVLYIGLKGWTNHNHYVVKFTNDAGDEVSIFLDGFKTYFYDGINPDTYVYSATLNTNSSFGNGDSQLVKSDDSYFMFEGIRKPITGGQVEITKQGVNFLITGEVESQDGTEYKFQYAGTMPMKKAKLNLNYAIGEYGGNYPWVGDPDGPQQEDVPMYDIVLSNLDIDGFSGPYYNCPGESVSFVFGGTYEDNGTLDPINYLQKFVPAGEYVYAADEEATESYGIGKVWPYWGDWWNETQFVDDDGDPSKDKMADSRFEVTVGAETANGYIHTITGSITTANGVEIEFTFEGPIKLEARGNTIRPRSTLTGDYAMRPLTQAYFADLGEEDTDLYYGELYLGTADSDPLGLEPENGEFILLSMFRSDEDDLLPVGNNHFTIGRYDEYLAMTINRPLQDELWDSSWLWGNNWDMDVPIFGVESISISKAPGGIYTINYVFLDDALPPHRITGSYTGEILDYWDEETPINAPARNYVEKLTERKPAKPIGKTEVRKAAKL